MDTTKYDRISDLLSELEFVDTHYVERRASVADIFRPAKRCGIYVLHCSQNEYYAGQAVDVVRRYGQHRATHRDIHSISFKVVTREKLDEEERRVIWALEEAGVALRNIALASVPVGESDFDLIMSLEEQEYWLQNQAQVSTDEQRFDDPDLRRRYQRKFELFSSMPEREDVVRVLREYVRVAIPSPTASEVAFWCCSCLPPSGTKGTRLFCRINLYLQEVLTIGQDSEGLFYSFHLALSPFDEHYGDRPERFLEKYPKMYADDHFYESGGSDQFRIEVGSADEAMELLHDPVVLSSLKRFNMRLMKKGPCLNKANHCLAMGDLLLAPEPNGSEEKGRLL